MPMLPRPDRVRLRDAAGRERSLDTGPASFDRFGTGPETVFLGLGPDPGALLALVPDGRAAYLECPEFAGAMPEGWHRAIPAGFTRLDPAALTPQRVARSRFLLYRQNPRLFPDFWGPVLANIRLALLVPDRVGRTGGDGTVLLARSAGDLLEPELARALGAMGRPVRDIPAGMALEAVTAALAETAPRLFLCVNGAGLDADGLLASLLDAAGVPVVAWCVDNPFHIISRLRAPFWKRVHLCVTDDWFVPRLRALGARSVHHLPLAAGAHFFDAVPDPGLEGQALFVGRAAFPDRDGFFAGCRLPGPLVARAEAMLAAGERPDFGWWLTALGLGPAWPDKGLRLAGFGAETAGRTWRGACLETLSRAMPTTIFGDAAWRELAPAAALRGPVDYYAGLAGLYAGAAVTVNLTSLLLPRGLTQRHFDVWAAGGLLATDATPGLDLFPGELTRPVTFASPGELGPLARTLAGDRALARELSAAWRALIRARHTYVQRLTQVFDVVGNAQRP